MNGKVLISILLLAILIAIGPLLTIWALNTLFNLNIPFNWQTWIAVILVKMAVRTPQPFRRS